MWSSVVPLRVTGYSSNFIDYDVGDGVGQWRLTGFYGCSESIRHQNSWNILHQLAIRSQLPWLCYGDYNITSLCEKVGRASHLMSGFREALSDANLNDIKIT